MGSYSMLRHPNFKLKKQRKNESDTRYALRMAAHLVSPPKVIGETFTMQCSDVAKQIRELEKIIEEQN